MTPSNVRVGANSFTHSASPLQGKIGASKK